MLVLSRKVGEKLVIGDSITLEVVRIAGNRITLGLAAPPEVKILRGELHQKAMELSKQDPAAKQNAGQRLAS